MSSVVGAAGSSISVGGRDDGLTLWLDENSGFPSSLGARTGGVSLSMSASLVSGGRDVPGDPRGLTYADAVERDDFTLAANAPVHRVDGHADVYVVTTRVGGWEVDWEYTFRREHPRVTIAFVLSRARGAEAAILRDVTMRFVVRPADPENWRVEAPGNELRPGIALNVLTGETPIAPAGGVMGSTSLLAVHQPRQPRTMVIWPLCRTEIGGIRVRGGDAFEVVIETGLAGSLTEMDTLRYEAVHLDLLDDRWQQVRDEIPSWYPNIGISTPSDRPEWTDTVSLYEVQIGFTPFLGGYRYEPYPDVTALRADLDRIQALGFDALQIMPRQPYPSYNVHDYADITTSYGDEDQLRQLVADCHARNMRVVLDILMHGVIDQDVVARTAQRVRESSFYSRIGEDTSRSWGTNAAARDATDVSWARHILDFEPHWMTGPARHPLLDEHPEWFMRDPGQNTIGIYNHAIDAANVAWHEYFCAAAEQLVRRLDIDGFRFDAPTYNRLPNWSTATRRRASYSPLGSLDLFDKLRSRLKRVKDSILLYTEPSGLLFRKSMDLTYSYEELWTVPALLDKSMETRRFGIRNGRELAEWMRERDAVLPPGSAIAHHIDSHDTFWWPLPGEKWRREEYGIDAARALLAVFSLSGGAYMTFVGGEHGLEEDVRRVHRLRRLPEFRHGVADYDAVVVEHDDVYSVLRRTEDTWSVVLVNLSARPVTAECVIKAEWHGNSAMSPELRDLWSGRTVSLTGLTLAPYQVCVPTNRHSSRDDVE